jgi:small subunit ribosomal protein S15
MPHPARLDTIRVLCQHIAENGLDPFKRVHSGIFPVLGVKYMALNKESASSIVAKFGKNDKDTGATEVQIALLTERINQLTEHCKQFKKDKSGQRGLLILVGKRRRMLKYIQRTNLEGYRKLIKELGLRK